ncbi:hypothetical protein FE257_001013 [Aspergillus nanangensis]|uniref:Enoyl reductase (ER) domain-containing protein n=1 Tax=Aspergillus nanangensis TaxID=2582783 RepID=A0AAD4CU59_ASPNN|nr:hypothetical protein FE257_001013 [Aspergillus nanangensis]
MGSHTPTTMKAALCKEFGQPIVIEEVPVPVPTGRELLVRVQAASLCHSDLTITSGALGSLPRPFIIGHEAVSIVEALGPDATGYGIKIGDSIGAPLWHGMCLECLDCKEHGPDFCPKKLTKGVSAPGYFSEYTLVDAACAVVLPAGDAASTAALSPLFCAGITVWDALERAKLQSGDTVAIIGAGGLGGLAARYAQAMGGKVIVLDVLDDQLHNLKGKGVADEILNTRSVAPEEVPAVVAALNKGRLVDVAIVTSGALPAYQTGLSIIRTQGRLIAVGIPHQELALQLAVFTGRCISLIGAKVPGQRSAQKCVDFSVRKGIMPEIHPRKFKLEDINEMMQLMEQGQVQEGRMVVQFF